MPGGKPTFAKFGAKKRAAYLQLLREGNHRCTSARGVGVSPELVRLYRKKYKAFGAEEIAAEEEACGLVEDALFQAAISGNVTACQVFLYNRVPDRWQDKRNVQVSGTGPGGAIPFTFVEVANNDGPTDAAADPAVDRGSNEA